MTRNLYNMKANYLGKLRKVNLRGTGIVYLARNSIVRYIFFHEILGYKKKDDERHKDMHSLVGVFIKSDKEE